MELKTIEERYQEYLETLSLTTLRIVGRNHGVPQSTSSNKHILIDSIINVLTGKAKPVPRSGKGAPPKQTYLDPAIMQKIAEIRRSAERERTENTFEVDSPDRAEPLFMKAVYTGILEIMQNGYGFLRAKNCQPSGGDVFVPSPVINGMRLRAGDRVACTAKPSQKNDSAAIEEVLSVNGLPVGKYENRPWFDTLTARYADEKIALSEGNGNLSLRLLDLFAPIGKGQRALIIAPPKAGKTTLLKDIARSIGERHTEIQLIILLIDERPEEVTDICMSVQNAEVISSTFDEGADHHVRAAELTLDHAKRMAEAGRDVVILLDSLTKLTRAYNYITESTGKTLSGGLDAGALAEPKRFFGAARNTVEAGSLTILATALVDTGSRMDDVIYEEFKGTGNSDIFLSRDLAERRVFPAVDVRRSGTRKEELLLTEKELSAVYKLRERGLTENAEGLLEMLKKTENNGEFVARLDEWLKIYRKGI